ncbi:hypothetical protein CASFOL_041402 [Castilleja foliolosa]|uniref:Uncharacterized protein n=1 Tax=Castilleja foliolosa TaxID=1961234 RepID=A0ABD3BB87_9LAMI
MAHENGGFRDLFKFLVYNDRESGAKFLESSNGDGLFQAELLRDENGWDHRWVIFVSIIARKIIKVFGKPMEWFGYIVEFILNLLSVNGNFLGLLSKILHGNMSMPKRGSETFISAIGHLDGRIDLFREITHTEMGNRALMDICVMASKLAYENDKVVKNVIDLHWKISDALCGLLQLLERRAVDHTTSVKVIAVRLTQTVYWNPEEELPIVALVF